MTDSIYRVAASTFKRKWNSEIPGHRPKQGQALLCETFFFFFRRLYVSSCASPLVARRNVFLTVGRSQKRMQAAGIDDETQALRG